MDASFHFLKTLVPAIVPGRRLGQCLRSDATAVNQYQLQEELTAKGNMKPLYIIALAITLCSGCASVVNDKTHPIKIETKNHAGEFVVGANCALKNDKAASTAKSGELSNVRRSSADLQITCKHPDNPDAVAKAISRVNGGMFGNLLLGGAIGAIIDHNTGNAYTYPTWIQLIFGQSLVFDRGDETADQPVPPKADTETSSSDSAPEIPADSTTKSGSDSSTESATTPVTESPTATPSQSPMKSVVEPEKKE